MKINTLDLIKPKSFHTAKEIIHKMKREPIEISEEKICTNDMTDKELISKHMNSLYSSI